LPFPGYFSEEIRLSPTHVPNDPAILEFGVFRLNPGERSLLNADGTPVQLTRRLYDTLLYMVERPGRLLEKQALMDAVWKGAVVEENTLSRTISNLRQLLGERAGEHRYIETVSGLGYRFIHSVTTHAADGAEPSAQRREPSIAVLPFEDLSRERDQGYFADGIAEEVLNRLASVAGLRVIAKSSSFRFRTNTGGAQAIGRALGVDYLLGGAVRKDGTELRVTTQLVDTATGSQRWSERFDHAVKLENIFALQDEIARAVTHALNNTLGVGQPRLTSRSTHDPEAYDLFLRATALAGQAGGQPIVRAAELFRAAVERDPNFAAAWLGLASAGRAKRIFAPERTAEGMQELHEAGAKVIELEPRWWAAHMIQSWLDHYRRDWLAMEQSLLRARELAPQMQRELEMNLGTLYAHVNDPDVAIEHFRNAVRLDPLSLLLSGLLQKELIVGGRYAEAAAEYRRSLDLSGDREMSEHLVLHSLWAHRKPFRDQLRRYLDLTQTKPAPVLDEVYSVCDDPPRAIEKLRAAAAVPEYQSATRQLVLAWWLAAYGDVESAFTTVWHSYVELDFQVVAWLWFPVFASVREHARFPDLLERVGLTAYWRAKNR
jgi:TolB-like protein